MMSRFRSEIPSSMVWVSRLRVRPLLVFRNGNRLAWTHPHRQLQLATQRFRRIVHEQMRLVVIADRENLRGGFHAFGIPFAELQVHNNLHDFSWPCATLARGL